MTTKENFILEHKVDDTYLHESGKFERSWHDALLMTSSEASTQQRALKLMGDPTHIRIYQDKEVRALEPDIQ